MTRDEAWAIAIARHAPALQGLPWQPGDTILRDLFVSGWDAHRESLKQAVMFTEQPTVTTGQAYPAATIYREYPRHIGKSEALKAIDKALRALSKQSKPLKDGVSPAYDFGWLLERTKMYKAATATWPDEDKKFIPHPATWFNRGSYDDDPQEWVRGAPAPKSQFSKSY